MLEYVKVRASETLEQGDLVSFLKANLSNFTRPVGRTHIEGTECVEARVPFNSVEFEEIRKFVQRKRENRQRGYVDFSIGRFLRKYSRSELRNAQLLRLTISPHFEPSGEECGTIYETHCEHCNWGTQRSDLILDLRRAPRGKDICGTIAWVEWVVSEKFASTYRGERLTGATLRRVTHFQNPLKSSREWHQLWISGRAGKLSTQTKLGKDPFVPDEVGWQCPRGHAIVASFLSEVYLHREQWDGSDFAVTDSLFGQGRNLLRPTPLIINSQRAYRAMEEAGIKGFSVEVAHLI